MIAEFTHLHLHTQYSLLDGAILMPDLIRRVKEHKMTHVAVTDHGNLFGALHFYLEAKSAGITPIFGSEVYVAGPKGRHDRTDKSSAHLVLLAKNNTGFKNLTYLVSMGYLEGFYYKPRIDKALLKDHSEGLIGLSACLGGVVNKHILRGDLDAAREEALSYKACFSPGDFYLEVQANGLPEQIKANAILQEFAASLDIPIAGTNDCHYLDQKDAAAHDLLMCVQWGISRNDPARKRHHTDKLFVRGIAEMTEAFRDIPGAAANTARIASQCHVELELDKTRLPRFPVPEGYEDRAAYLRKIARDGMAARFKEITYPVDRDAYIERLEFELNMIAKMDFPGYFLIVWDFIKYAKDHGIPVGPGRGSGAGSLVAYALRITDVDPIPHDLLFERFLNPERVSMPDFDIDFCMNRRNEVIDYVTRKYGRDNVGQIATFAELRAKSAVRDVGRVMDLPYSEVDIIAKLIPDGPKVTLKPPEKIPPGKDITSALAAEPKLGELIASSPVYQELWEISEALEGCYRQAGMHAAGIVISDEPLHEIVPVFRGQNGEIVTQYHKDHVEKVGLIKFDFLGLKTLTVIDHAVRLINEGNRAGNPFDITKIPLDDPGVYEMLSAGDTYGVFQLESSGITETCRQLRPDHFEELVALLALYRPGPLNSGMVKQFIDRKHGREQIPGLHPDIDPILQPTYGVIVYQEQVMRIAQTLCGFTLGGADVLRKAMGKKKADIMAAQRDKFVNGGVARGVPAGTCEAIFSSIEKFAEYGFNKSHSVAYAYVTYQTAYLKRHFPVEFLAALLTSDRDNTDKVVYYISEATRAGIQVKPPHINDGVSSFSVVGGAILFGLSAIKGVGEAAVDGIIEERQRGGPFASLFDLCARADARKVNKKIVESLIKAGALDDFQPNRASLMASVDIALERGAKAYRDRISGQKSLFGDGPAADLKAADATRLYVAAEPWSEAERLAGEKEALGYYISGHPLDYYDDIITKFTNATAASARTAANTEVILAGVVTGLREMIKKDESGRWAKFTLEDKTGSIEVHAYTRVFAGCEAALKADKPVWVRGRVRVEGDDEEAKTVKIQAQEIQLLGDVKNRAAQRLAIRVAEATASFDRLRRLKELLGSHRGECRVELEVILPNHDILAYRLDGYSVAPSEALLDQLSGLFGSAREPVYHLE